MNKQPDVSKLLGLRRPVNSLALFRGLIKVQDHHKIACHRSQSRQAEMLEVCDKPTLSDSAELPFKNKVPNYTRNCS